MTDSTAPLRLTEHAAGTVSFPSVRLDEETRHHRDTQDTALRAAPPAASPGRAAIPQKSGAGRTPSSASNCRLVSTPPPNPPMPPSLPTTRWHGTTTGSGLAPIAAPTA